MKKYMGTIAAAVIVATLFGSPAHANTAEGVVAGAGTITDDWGDEGVLSQAQHRHSGATGMWQWVLYADGAIETDGTTFDEDQIDIDCDFGANTAIATKSWQSMHQLQADGVVGVNTLSKADDKLRLGSDGTSITYVGKKHTIYLGSRTSDHSYYIDMPTCICQGAVFRATYGKPEFVTGSDGCY